jgi:Chaperone of endosialidase
VIKILFNNKNTLAMFFLTSKNIKIAIITFLSVMPFILDGQIVVKPNLHVVVGDTAGIVYDGRLTVDSKNKQYGVVVQNNANDTATNRVIYGFLNSLNTNLLPNALPRFDPLIGTTYWGRIAYHNQFGSKQGTFNTAIDNTITESIGNVTPAETSGLVNTISNASNSVIGVQNQFIGIKCPIATGFGNYIDQNTFGSRATSVQGLYNNFIVSSDTLTYGIRNRMQMRDNSTGRTFGIYSDIYNFNIGGTGARYGIYSRVQGSGTNWWAGYFEGNVVVTGTFSNGSDLKLKENIVDLTGALTKIKKLSPKQYDIKSEKNRTDKKKHSGLIAQEVESILPEIVSDIESPGQSTNIEEKVKIFKSFIEIDANGKSISVERPVEIVRTNIVQGIPDKLKVVNYIELIPFLLQAIKEQQEIIESLQKDVDKLKIKVGN